MKVDEMTHEQRVVFVIDHIGDALHLEEEEAAAILAVLDRDAPTTSDQREAAAWVIAAALEAAR